jgi:ribose transport system substrate-binding protein
VFESLTSGLRRTAAVASVFLAVFVIAGCGGDDEAADTETEPAPAQEAEPLDIAYLSASTANTWLASSKKAMEEVAAKENVTITEFDGQFKPEEQTKQLQDAIASQKYDGIVIAAISGEGIIPDLQDAIDQGIKVAVLNQVVGPKLDTPDPQVEGISVSVLAPPLRSGERLGKLTLQACEGMDPCRVAYLYGIKGIPLDTALREGFDSVIAENPAIEVVAEGEGKYLGPDEGAKATQTILAATPDFDVLIGSDQSVQGAQQALEDAGKLDKVKLIGLGGSEAAITAIRDGKWYGGVFGAPYDEGKIAIEALIEAIRENKDTGGVDPLTRLPDEGLVTTDNVDKFESQWAG